jgi:hypothetical protein
MSDWRHNSSGYWSNQGSGHAAQYPNTIDEEELEDDQAYADIGGGHTYDSPQAYQHQDDHQVYQQQAYWIDTQGQPVHASNQQQYYQDQQYYQPAEADHEDVTYTPTTYTGSMDVNFR